MTFYKTASKLLAVFLISLLPHTAFAQVDRSGFNFSGQLTDVNGDPIASTTVSFEIDILTATGACLLRRESQSVTTDPLGRFSIVVGNGAYLSGPAATIAQAFSSGFFCSPETTGPNDARFLQVRVNGDPPDGPLDRRTR